MSDTDHDCYNCLHTDIGASEEPCSTCGGGASAWQPAVGIHDSGERQDTILDEAKALIFGDRQGTYGHPADDYAKVAKIWSGVLMGKLTKEITPREAMLCMIGIKMSREAHLPKRDNLVDIAGYAGCIERLAERKESE